MQELTVTTPALIFPVVSLFFISFNSRFLTLANRVRTLVDEWEQSKNPDLRRNIQLQLTDLRFRVSLIKGAQFMGAVALLLAVAACLILLWLSSQEAALLAFTLSLASLLAAVSFLLAEIVKSTSTLNLVLKRVSPPQE